MGRAWWMLGLVLLAGCSDSGPPVDIVVPKGVTGPVWIILDPQAQKIPVVSGRYQVVIPAGGVLRVRSLRPFSQWHQESARYDDGTPLPLVEGANPAGPDQVALRGGANAVTNRNGKEIRWVEYFVGTAKQHGERPSPDLPPGEGRPQAATSTAPDP